MIRPRNPQGVISRHSPPSNDSILHDPKKSLGPEKKFLTVDMNSIKKLFVNAFTAPLLQ